MKVKAGKTFAPFPEGLHIAVCTEVVDLGTQAGEWKGKPNAIRKVSIRFTAPHVLFEDGELAGQPRSIGMIHTASLGEKANLRKLLESWRGKKFTAAELDGFELAVLLGKPCQIQVLQEEKNGKVYANIQSIVGIPQGTAIPAVDKDTFVSFDLDNFDEDTFNALPDWQKEMIVDTPEYEAAVGGAPAPGEKTGQNPDADDDIPF
jgi:hypothetical protein